MPHTFYCSTVECDKEVDSYEAVCDSCLAEQMSHETSECPGCGNDIYCGANGYCSNCWAERFGCESPISFAEEDEDCGLSAWSQNCTCPPSLVDGHRRRARARGHVFEPPEAPWRESPTEHVCSGEWNYDRGTRACDNDDDPKCPLYRNDAFDHEIGQWACGNPTADDDNYRFRMRLSSVDEQIENAEERLRFSRGMTPGQVKDWETILAKLKLKSDSQSVYCDEPVWADY